MAARERERLCRVLFLCTGNSARSILAEAILNNIGKGKFVGYSAGSHPARRVNPHALALLDRFKVPTAGLRCKSWNEFARTGGPELDFVFTLCDNSANEVCPVWPGRPMTAHWSVPNPTTAQGDEAALARAFLDAYLLLELRIQLFAELPVKRLDRSALNSKLDEIGKSGGG